MLCLTVVTGYALIHEASDHTEGCSGPPARRASTPLFGSTVGEEFTHAQLDAALELLLVAGAGVAEPDSHKYSVHSFRIFTPCALLAAGADVDQAMAGNNPGATPLYAAAMSGSLGCASLLCEAGAKINARTFNGASPMLVAAQEGRLLVAMLLSSYGAGRGPAYLDDTGILVRPARAEHLARDSGNQELLAWMRASYRYTALHHATSKFATEESIALLPLLVRHGADANAQNRFG